jgi:hypothetical protein
MVEEVVVQVLEAVLDREVVLALEVVWVPAQAELGNHLQNYKTCSSQWCRALHGHPLDNYRMYWQCPTCSSSSWDQHLLEQQ